ncbi:MAG: hypothetical protein K6F39_04990 [Lachnospiraceae bacterium]|nr:hypothetical protein [Lachnospiraceae bacterium]
MRINSNITAYITNNALHNNENMFSASSRKLSSGFKINVAGDDPTGYAISGRMRQLIGALDRCDTNATNGKSVCETADAALSEVTSMVQRLNELAVKSANGVLSSSDREMIQSEAEQLTNEIQRIADTTEYNGQKLFDGTFVDTGYTTDKDIKVVHYSDDLNADTYEDVNITETTTAGSPPYITVTCSGIPGREDDVEMTVPVTYVDPEVLTDGNATAFFTGVYMDDLNRGSVNFCADGSQIITINGDNGEEITYKINSKFNDTEVVSDTASTYTDSDGNTISYFPVTLSTGNFDTTLTGNGAMRVQVGANEDEAINMTLPSISLEMLDLDDLDLSTEAGAEVGIGKIKYALQYLNKARSTIGAYQNRIEQSINYLAASSENLNTSVSRIADTDMAEEMISYTNAQVLVQASTSMLAQANQAPQQALQLLQ